MAGVSGCSLTTESKKKKGIWFFFTCEPVDSEEWDCIDSQAKGQPGVVFIVWESKLCDSSATLAEVGGTVVTEHCELADYLKIKEVV